MNEGTVIYYGGMVTVLQLPTVNSASFSEAGILIYAKYMIHLQLVYRKSFCADLQRKQLIEVMIILFPE